MKFCNWALVVAGLVSKAIVTELEPAAGLQYLHTGHWHNSSFYGHGHNVHARMPILVLVVLERPGARRHWYCLEPLILPLKACPH